MGDVADGDDSDCDVDNFDMTQCKEREKLLNANKERQTELLERLQVKLKALNSELAARREEAERIKAESDQLRNEERRGEAERRAQGEASGSDVAVIEEADERQNKIRRCVEEQLQKQLNSNAKTRSARNEHGIRTFDEMSLMVEKPAEEQKKEVNYIDTVLITYTKGSSSEQTYKLTYRVDRNMTSKQLRKDACAYWETSEVEYILKTVTENSKVQDDVTIQTCFRANEDAHLYLVKKSPTDDRLLDAEKRATDPKTSRVKKKVQQQVQAQNTASPSMDFYKQMDSVPGFKEFMTQRDHNVVAHLPGLWLQSICLFMLLAIASLMSVFVMVPEDNTYFCRTGIYRSLAGPWYDSVSGTRIPALADLKSNAQVWAWLNYTLPTHVFNPQSQLRKDNYLVGWLRLRMQQVKPPAAEFCGAGGDDEKCFPQHYQDQTLGDEDLATLKDAWQGRAGQAGRSDRVQPWRFVSAKDNADSSKTKDQGGRFQSYDGSGYMVDYNLQTNQSLVLQAFQSDMALLKDEGWISRRTRAVHVSFAIYNGNFDKWASVWYLLEFPVMGVVHTSSDVTVFEPVTLDYGTGQLQLAVDAVRLLLVLYMVTVHLYMVRDYHIKHYESERSGWFRIPCGGRRGIMDLLIFAILVYIWVTRYLIFSSISETTADEAASLRQKYKNIYANAREFFWHNIFEAVVFGLAVFRMMDGLRVNRQIFIIWCTITQALWRYSYFCLVFVPTILCLALFGHSVHGSMHAQYRTFWSSFASTLMMMRGNLEITSADEMVTHPIGLLFMCVFYLIVLMLFMNVWIGVLCQSYQIARVSAGFDPTDYDWNEERYAEWWLWGPLARFYIKHSQRCRRRRRNPPADKTE